MKFWQTYRLNPSKYLCQSDNFHVLIPDTSSNHFIAPLMSDSKSFSFNFYRLYGSDRKLRWWRKLFHLILQLILMTYSFAFSFVSGVKKNSSTHAGLDSRPGRSPTRRHRQFPVHNRAIKSGGGDSLDHRRSTAANERLIADTEQWRRLDINVKYFN